MLGGRVSRGKNQVAMRVDHKATSENELLDTARRATFDIDQKSLKEEKKSGERVLLSGDRC